MKNALLITLIFLLPFVLKAQIKIKASNAIHIDEKFISCDDEVYATFPGGIGKFNRYLAKNIHYPAQSVKSNIQGKVLLAFAIEKDGSISKVKIIKGVSPDIDIEALRVLKNSPKWIPTKMCGKAVRTQYNIPIDFILPSQEIASNTQTKNVEVPDLDKIDIKDPADSTKLKNEDHNLYLDGSVTEEKDITATQREPQFPDGIQAFYDYISSNIRKIPFAKYVKGKVIVRFVIDSDGHVIKPAIVDGAITGVMKQEILGIFRRSPTWHPGMQNNKAVRIQYTMPLNF